jgi:putative alpha-1,2-mannosidase
LKITLDSFFKFNTYPIKEFYIYEDSGLPVPAELKELYPFIKWFEPANRTGQIVALDTLWQAVKTPYAFTMEDDWETYRSGFIEGSMEILEANPKIMQVWLREKEDTNQHPIIYTAGQSYGIMASNNGLWAGTCFNPSLKRKCDYDQIKSYSKWTQFNRHRPWKSEADISQKYHQLGFKAAILPQGYIKHIGYDRHVS